MTAQICLLSLSLLGSLALGPARLAGEEVAVPVGRLLNTTTLSGRVDTGVGQGPLLELRFDPVPATEAYRVLFSSRLDGPFEILPEVPFGFRSSVPLGVGDSGFYQILPQPLPPQQLEASTLLHRLAYGPTPDELERVRKLGTVGYIEEQLAPETVVEDLDTLDPTPQWRKVTVTGLGSSSKLYLYLDGPGDLYLDDLRLVAGIEDDGTQSNLLKNGGFETPLGTDWNLSSNLATSARSAEFVHAGDASLHLVSTAAGETQASSIFQTITPSLSATQPYTLSYWYRTSDQAAKLTVRLSGSGILSHHALGGELNTPAPIYTQLQSGTATRADLVAWHLLRAIQSRRQLQEVLRQFLENHFVTQVTKTLDYFDNRGYDGVDAEKLAVRTEFQENRRWRDALLNPQVTFLDLLKISAESPAMIVYLDTVTSRGDGKNVANENYARELCELFCFGVDNGYDQNDIVQISRAWTGWRIDLLTPENEFTPLAPRSTNYLDPSVVGSGLNANTNVLGVWGFRYIPDRHYAAAKYIFYNWDSNGNRLDPKKVPERFGPPWAGREYGKYLPARTGAAGLQDGYDILSHMADQPFTQEFLSVKLCRLFIHDGFAHGYDFADAESTPEEDLVHRCMLAWENSVPRGQIRNVLRVIFESELFQGHAASLQKVKTPLEFAVSTVRALRSRKADGSWTADTDGYGFSNFLNRSGRMRLFDRAEPDGYPEDAPGWISAGTLAERLRFVQAALMPAGMTGKDDAGINTQVDLLSLLRLKVGSDRLRDAGAIVDYLLGLLFPAEGAANLAEYRQMAVQYLDTAEDGTTASPWSQLIPGSTTYDQRVRGLVGLLMSTQRFQEQ